MSRIKFVVIMVVSGLLNLVVQAANVPALNLPGGVHDFATVPNSPAVELNGQLTLEAWLYPTAWRSYSGREKHGLNFMYKGRIGSHIDYMFSLQANGYLCFGNTKGTIGILRPVVPLNQWTHVAVSIHEASGTIKFYVNGVDQGGYGTWGGGVDRYNPILPSSHPLYVGGFNQLGWGYNNDNFIGKMAEARIWKTARTAAEIQANYLKQLKGNESGLSAYWNYANTLDKSLSGANKVLTGSASLQIGQGPNLQSPGGIEVTVTSPTNNAIASQGGHVTINATAINTNGVSQVSFFRGTNLIAVDTTAPFSVVWSNVPGGTHTLSAKATNNNGEVGTSADITLKVQGPYKTNAFPVPGWIEFENYDLGGQDVAFHDTTVANEGGQYRTSNGVDISADNKASNGYTVGWTKAGEWISYTINVISNGAVDIKTRVAGVGLGGQFRILINNVDKTGILNVPNTGAWNTYQMVTKEAVVLTQGIHTMRVVMVQNGSSGFVGAFDTILMGAAPPPPPPPPPPEQGAFPNGLAWAVPGTIEFENFDTGGVSVAYFDSTLANEGGQYRPGDGVDIGNDAGAGNGRVVGWTKTGEWMEYTVNVGGNGLYDLDVRVAGAGAGGQFRVEVDGSNVSGTLNVPNTGAWNVYQVVTKTGINLDAGIHTVRVHMVAQGVSGFVGAFDWFRFKLAVLPGTQVAYPSGIPTVLPGIIEVENFDAGGPGVAYSDTTVASLGVPYRPGEQVDVANEGNAGNGRSVGWTHPGEWMEYTFQIEAVSGYGHFLQTRVAGVGTGGQFRFEIDGIDVTGVLDVPNTGAWNNFANVPKQLLDGVLTPGIHTARLVMVKNGTSGFVGAFDRFVLTNVEPPPAEALAKVSKVKTPALIAIQSSQEADQPGAAWAAVDGDAETAWQGVAGAGGWWLVLVYDPTKQINTVDIAWAGEPVAETQILFSQDSDQWTDLASEVVKGPIAANYLWIIIPDNGTGEAPAIKEVIVE